MLNRNLASHAPLRTGALGDRVAAALAAVLVGAALLFATGLADANLLHDAAHDARHGFAFPCH